MSSSRTAHGRPDAAVLARYLGAHVRLHGTHLAEPVEGRLARVTDRDAVVEDGNLIRVVALDDVDVVTLTPNPEDPR